MKNIDNEKAGKYRCKNVTIKRATHIPPDYLIILVIIKKESKLKYYEILDKSHTTGNYTDFIKLINELDSSNVDYEKITTPTTN